jgi:hypothetical protein
MFAMNIKHGSVLCLGIFTLLSAAPTFAQSKKVTTLQEYNQELPLWGTAWGAGSSAIGHYYPSFYTGFTIRSEYPERIHVRLARGNQTRVSVILDEKTIIDYAFDLEKRYQVYKNLVAASIIDTTPSGAAIIPQMDYFSQIIESETYGVLNLTKAGKEGTDTDKNIYAKNLDLLKKLNPNRVFNLKINLKTEFLKWKSYLQNILGTSQPGIADNSNHAVVALNTLLWGRVNVVEAPSTDVQQKLKSALALIDGNETEFLTAARDLFVAATGSKYNFKVQNAAGEWESAIQCQDVNQCYLSYPEITSIYPTGSVKSFASDEFGNKIPKFASPGLWKFIDSNSSGAVDNIRSEGYYGWIPKMDYEEIGNGYHNPAVLFSHISRSTQDNLGIHPDQDKLWAVMRGGVSHGCSRLPVGHAWEMRHTFPVENSKMTQIYFFNNNPLDFDLYDVNGDGQLEIMGVEYLISYDLAGTSDLARREGKDLEISTGKKLDFYSRLYGSKNVYKLTSDNKLIFINPGLSMPSHMDFKKKSVSTRVTLQGEYQLYEQTYEKDKIQFYLPTGGINKPIIRLLGRVRGCAPTADKTQCGEASFASEAQKLTKGAVN